MTMIDATMNAIIAMVVKPSSVFRPVYRLSFCLYVIAREDNSCVSGSISASALFISPSIRSLSASNDASPSGSFSMDGLNPIFFRPLLLEVVMIFQEGLRDFTGLFVLSLLPAFILS
jgi:hypothetical protein